MRTLRILTAVTLLFLATGTARSDGLLYQLPKDGTWGAFDWQENFERPGVKNNRKGTLIMSSVGRTTEGENECRWIEYSFEGTRNGREETSIDKFLIPEKYLKKGENPIGHIVRVWEKYHGAVREFEVNGDGNLEYPAWAPLPAWIAGLLENVEKLDKKVVESKLGKLECEGLTGSTNWIRSYRQRKIETQLTFHIRLHKEAPFGVVTARIHSETSVNGKPSRSGTVTLKLSDFGEGAESELPDHN